MADPTSNFGWDLPNNGTEADTWGATLNAVLQSIDTELWAHLPRAGSRPMTGTLTFVAGSTTVAPAKFQAGSLLTTPVAHAVEWDGANAYVTTSAGSRKTLAYADGNITGSAAKWTTARTLTVNGDVSGSVVIDGSENETLTLEIGAGKVGNTELADMAANTLKGDNGSGVSDLTVAQVLAMLGVASISGNASAWAASFGNGAVLVKGGRYAGGSSNPPISFAAAFPTACLGVLLVAENPSNGVNSTQVQLKSGSVTASGFEALCRREDNPGYALPATDVAFTYWAIGN